MDNKKAEKYITNYMATILTKNYITFTKVRKL